jgi:hypothetical protein
MCGEGLDEPPKPVIEHRTPKVRTGIEEGHMCPVCIANAAAVVAGAGSTGGVLAVFIGKLKKFFTANRPGQFQKTKER